MDTVSMRKHWKQIARSLKRRFGILKDTDLVLSEGKEEELMAAIGQKLGKTRDDLRMLIEAL
jgi:uncharacterized protein YjbJ (UPF0337 family)